MGPSGGAATLVGDTEYHPLPSGHHGRHPAAPCARATGLLRGGRHREAGTSGPGVGWRLAHSPGTGPERRVSPQICSLLRGGAAERGGVRVGHRIIEVNGQSVVAMPHTRIIQLLTEAREVREGTSPDLKACHPCPSPCHPTSPLHHRPDLTSNSLPLTPRFTSRRCQLPPTGCSRGRNSQCTCDRPAHACLRPGPPPLSAHGDPRILSLILLSNVKEN